MRRPDVPPHFRIQPTDLAMPSLTIRVGGVLIAATGVPLAAVGASAVILAVGGGVLLAGAGVAFAKRPSALAGLRAGGGRTGVDDEPVRLS